MSERIVVQPTGDSQLSILRRLTKDLPERKPWTPRIDQLRDTYKQSKRLEGADVPSQNLKVAIRPKRRRIPVGSIIEITCKYCGKVTEAVYNGKRMREYCDNLKYCANKAGSLRSSARWAADKKLREAKNDA